MGMTKTSPFDAADYLDSPVMIAAYLEASFDEAATAGEIAEALGTIARAKGMTALAQKAGVTREALYKALSADGNPRLTTLMQVMAALGLKLAPVPIDKAA